MIFVIFTTGPHLSKLNRSLRRVSLSNVVNLDFFVGSFCHSCEVTTSHNVKPSILVSFNYLDLA